MSNNRNSGWQYYPPNPNSTPPYGQSPMNFPTPEHSVPYGGRPPSMPVMPNNPGGMPSGYFDQYEPNYQPSAGPVDGGFIGGFMPGPRTPNHYAAPSYPSSPMPQLPPEVWSSPEQYGYPYPRPSTSHWDDPPPMRRGWGPPLTGSFRNDMYNEGYRPPAVSPGSWEPGFDDRSRGAPPPPFIHAASTGSSYASEDSSLEGPSRETSYYNPRTPISGEGQGSSTFQYSRCTGAKRALLIGINYAGSLKPLLGCINDTMRVKKFIQKHFNYKDEDIVILTDNPWSSPERQPTRANIILAMGWLVRSAKPNDSLFFHFSGHGGRTKDLDGDEASGYDSVIQPMDVEPAGHIVDDEMHDIMVKPLPAGCRLTAIFDCCYSGTALDLPYTYSSEGLIKNPDRGRAGFSTRAKRTRNFARQTKSSPADVISWSACKESQTSADTEVNGQKTGAMSWAFTESLNRNPQQSFQQLLLSTRDLLLNNRYLQRPQLSSSHPMDTGLLFIA